MTGQEAIELHIQENLHRISAIESFLSISPDADGKECHKNISVLMKVNGLLQEIQKYREIGTVEEYQEAMERQNAKKPKVKVQDRDLKIGCVIFKAGTKTYWCPSCRKAITGSDGYCRWCGQAIDWSGIE